MPPPWAPAWFEVMTTPASAPNSTRGERDTMAKSEMEEESATPPPDPRDAVFPEKVDEVALKRAVPASATLAKSAPPDWSAVLASKVESVNTPVDDPARTVEMESAPPA